MLQMNDRLQQRMLERRQDAWLQQQIAIARDTYPLACDGLEDDALGKRIEALRDTAAGLGIEVDANQQRFMHLALAQNDDAFHTTQDWATTIFAWDADENMKLSACEQYLAGNG